MFDAEDEEIELAFKIAVDWLNSDEILLKNSRVIATVEKLHSEDSFKATKLGEYKSQPFLLIIPKYAMNYYNNA